MPLKVLNKHLESESVAFCRCSKQSTKFRNAEIKEDMQNGLCSENFKDGFAHGHGDKGGPGVDIVGVGFHIEALYFSATQAI